ncbi:hypothetical protein AVI51_07265 [Piscirickettsia salmonis]|uniref:Uncharacterized protein n=1 Tax=Piscirickettsia salmonis TaxID=1238 RepID=A0A9Q5V9T8_PISSA|nr:hypothetical protein [Piscirickettsia salmonis]ALA25875.1 acetate kinase [Piscirickettsia salmonis]APS43349.1 hypothetical protein AVI48_02475 [Piscirickettsia salmonis]APS46699.1 hypothetical protein AVI49_03080 [Piscirickettsia salmonis]APS53877.1 hypothetical protein AVI51_07265 [Piscirickettsia salmonis]APS56946.1 hypothetical protein AVI52_06620 [Piscirickettsia salmonis]
MALQDLKNNIKELLLNIKRHEKSKFVSRDGVERNVNQVVDNATSIANKFAAKAKALGSKFLAKKNVKPEPVPDPSPSIDSAEDVEQIDSRSRVAVIKELLGQVDGLGSGRDSYTFLVGLQQKEAFWGKGSQKAYFHRDGHESLKAELVECLSACKEQILQDIRLSIENQAKSGEFKFGYGGSRYKLEVEGQFFSVSKRALQVCEIIKDPNPDFTVEAKFEAIKKIKAVALTYQPSFPWFRRLTGIGDTKESTNNFLAGLDCAEGCYNEPALG